MTHFSVHQWVDYVRKLAQPAIREAMREHLESCALCRSTVESFEAVASVAASDSQAVIPPEAIARAEALFEPRPVEHAWMQSLRELVAELVFDSSQQLHPAGVRGSALARFGAVRQMTYHAGDYNVDLRIELTGDGGLDIVGQVAHRDSHAQDLEGALVQVVVGGKTVGETETNRFGEFLLERPMKPSGTLRILLRREACRIDLPLKQGKRK